MTKFDATGTLLIFPDGSEIAPDAKGVKLTDDALENAGIKSWIDEGLLVVVAPEKAAKVKKPESPV